MWFPLNAVSRIVADPGTESVDQWLLLVERRRVWGVTATSCGASFGVM